MEVEGEGVGEGDHQAAHAGARPAQAVEAGEAGTGAGARDLLGSSECQRETWSCPDNLNWLFLPRIIF